jgi:hypothetical protein
VEQNAMIDLITPLLALVPYLVIAGALAIIPAHTGRLDD